MTRCVTPDAPVTCDQTRLAIAQTVSLCPTAHDLSIQYIDSLQRFTMVLKHTRSATVATLARARLNTRHVFDYRCGANSSPGRDKRRQVNQPRYIHTSTVCRSIPGNRASACTHPPLRHIAYSRNTTRDVPRKVRLPACSHIVAASSTLRRNFD
ncbi:hypothetical protein OH76DRAFT_226400 [Lentinus brumalis]|uniref:Uncharacterized protein n=1 Tax=Lentinus brumalis TaxID=2498619 RepID=A0A371DH86_9APHY|nr:hypothetical protein OH76DRAFT_226400 [Polyporus brumalis]